MHGAWWSFGSFEFGFRLRAMLASVVRGILWTKIFFSKRITHLCNCASRDTYAEETLRGVNTAFSVQEGDLDDPMGKAKQQDNPFIEPSQQHAVVDMKGRLNDPLISCVYIHIVLRS